MTGATGDLTPDETEGDFEPGELHEQHAADVTRHQAHHGRGHDPVDPARTPSAGGDTVEERDERF